MNQLSNKYLSPRWPEVRRPAPKYSRKRFPIGPLEVHDRDTFRYLIYNLKYNDYDGRFAHPQDFVFKGLYQFRNVRRRGKKEGYGVEIKRKLPGDAKRHQTTVFSRTFPNYKLAGEAHDSVERDFQSGDAETFFKNRFVDQYLRKTTKANEIRKKVRAGIKPTFDPKRLHFPEETDWTKMRELNKLNRKSNFANTNYNKFQNQWTAESSRKIWKPYVTNQKGTVKGVGKTDLEAAVNFEWQVYLLNRKFQEEKKQHVFNHVLHGWFDAIFDWRHNMQNSGKFKVHINDNRFWNWGAIIDFNDLMVRGIRNGSQFWFHGITNGVTIISVNGRPVNGMNMDYILQKLRDQTECDITFAKQKSRIEIKNPSSLLSSEIEEISSSSQEEEEMQRVFAEPKAVFPFFPAIQNPGDGIEKYFESMTDDSDTSYYKHDAVNSTHKAELIAFGPADKGSNLKSELATNFPETKIEQQDFSTNELTMDDILKYDFKLGVQPKAFEKDSCDKLWFSGGENESPSFERRNPGSSEWSRIFERSAQRSEEESDPSKCLMCFSDDTEMSIEEQHDFCSSRGVCTNIVRNKIPATYLPSSLFPAGSTNDRQRNVLIMPTFQPLEYLSHEIIRESF